jgi:pimeloyl-ACP methyl ester carboxylesterase
MKTEMTTVHDIELDTGVRVQCAEQYPNGDRTCLFLHGYSDTWFSFTPVLARLMDDVHSLALTQRGHGGSEKPDTGYAIQNFADDAAALLRSVETEDVVVVGHSMGSFVAQRLASDYPELVDRLVLVGSAPNGENDAVMELAGAVDRLNGEVSRDFVYEFQHGTTHEALPDIFMDRVIDESLRMPSHVWKKAMSGFLQADTRADLQDIDMPTLVVWGEEDLIFGEAEQDALLEALPNAEMQAYPNTGHAVHWERPSRFVHDLRLFL